MKKALVIGLGVSGRAASRFLLKQGYAVSAVERNTDLLSTHAEIKELRKQGLVALPDSTALEVQRFDLLVPSPGVPHEHPLYRAADANGVEIIGEAELAFRHMRQKAVAITGTNGKTTVTLLVEHILRSCGHKARALGNIGEPLTTYFLNSDPDEIVVAELSSYQLETMQSKIFEGAVLLNITPDHLDRYASMREYADAKFHLQHCLKPGAPFYVYEQAAREFGGEARSYQTFGSAPAADYWTDRYNIYCGEEVACILPVRYRELGGHESENALGAWLLVRQFGVTPAQFAEALESFTKPPHRIEFVARIKEVSYFDDSKGTNLDAVIQAVKTMSGPVILIAGGVDKGASYVPWADAFAGKVKRVIALGQAAQKIEKELKFAMPVMIVGSMQEAVCQAYTQAKKGDNVLLSPGCSSFDMFRDYAHRGEEFKRFVNELSRS